MEIENKKIRRYLSAAINFNGKFLLLKSKDEDEFKKVGYFFPGCRKEISLNNEDTLANQLFLKYQLKVKVSSFIGDTLINDGDDIACLYLYKCDILKGSAFVNASVEAKLFSPNEFSGLKFDKADGLLAKRLSVFYKCYFGEPRVKALTNDEKNKIKLFYKSLIYFSSKINRQDLVDFENLIKSDATIEDISLAYEYVCLKNKISLKEYLSH